MRTLYTNTLYINSAIKTGVIQGKIIISTMATEQVRPLCSYKQYFIYTARDITDVLNKHAAMLSKHVDNTRGPYYYVTLKRKMTLPKLLNLIGDENVLVEPYSNVLELTRCDIAKAKKEYEELIKRGKIILDVLSEDNTPEDVLNVGDRRAVKAYRRSMC